MLDARLDESQSVIKISRRNINNYRYADDCCPMAEKEEELKKSLDEGERRERKSWFKTKKSKDKDHGIHSHHFMANRRGKVKKVTYFLFSSWVPKSL